MKTEQGFEHKAHLRLARGSVPGFATRQEGGAEVKTRAARHIGRRRYEPRPRATVDGAQKQPVVLPRLHRPPRKLVQLPRSKLLRLKVGGRLGEKHLKQQALKLDFLRNRELTREFTLRG